VRTSKIFANKPSLVAERLGDFHYSNKNFLIIISVFAANHKIAQNTVPLLADNTFRDCIKHFFGNSTMNNNTVQNMLWRTKLTLIVLYVSARLGHHKGKPEKNVQRQLLNYTLNAIALHLLTCSRRIHTAHRTSLKKF
jgi:hypothetical protein